MQIYMVGGAVRDKLLGRPVNDHDWVVVGATPEQMLELGYLPVGRDFPVFLHPETRERARLPGLCGGKLARRDAGRRPFPPRPHYQCNSY